jgi:hypothetical protein
LSGDTAIVAGQSAAQEVYVFVRSDGTWSQQQILTSGKALDASVFGYTVALSGNTALVWGSALGEYAHIPQLA